jgi:large subunit ribosomal protein L6
MKIEIELPKDYSAKMAGKKLAIIYNGKENSREIFHPLIAIKIEGNKIILESKKETKNIKKILMAYSSHIENMIHGLKTPFVYKLKICASHYPMTVKVEGKKIIINNYLGEKVPRTCKIVGNASVKIDKDIITIESVDKESAGMTAGIIEKTCQIRNHDRRIFQDGIYIIEKEGIKI